MNVNENTVKRLGSFLIERQEADIVAVLARKMNATADEALLTYYASDLAFFGESIEAGERVADKITESPQPSCSLVWSRDMA